MPFAIHYRAKFSLSEVELQDGYVYRGIFPTQATAMPGAHCGGVSMLESKHRQPVGPRVKREMTAGQIMRRRKGATCLRRSIRSWSRGSRPASLAGQRVQLITNGLQRPTSFSSSCAREAALQRRNASLDAESRKTGRRERRPDLTAFVKRWNVGWRSWESAPGRSEADRAKEKLSPGQSVRQKRCWVLSEPTRISNRSQFAQVTA